MQATFVDLESKERLDELFKESHKRPIAIFKHSNSCGISADIYDQISRVDAEINIVVVQTNRGVSDEIEHRTGIRHASPQLFVVKDGDATHHASHYSISPDRLREAMR